LRAGACCTFGTPSEVCYTLETNHARTAERQMCRRPIAKITLIFQNTRSAVQVDKTCTTTVREHMVQWRRNDEMTSNMQRYKYYDNTLGTCSTTFQGCGTSAKSVVIISPFSALCQNWLR